jgi:hypothetical protein
MSIFNDKSHKISFNSLVGQRAVLTHSLDISQSVGLFTQSVTINDGKERRKERDSSVHPTCSVF